MAGLRSKILCGAAGASGGLSGILSLSRCSGGACASCLGCLGAGAGILLAAMINKSIAGKEKRQGLRGEGKA